MSNDQPAVRLGIYARRNNWNFCNLCHSPYHCILMLFSDEEEEEI